MRPAAKKAVLIGGALAMVAIVTGGVLALRGSPAPASDASEAKADPAAGVNDPEDTAVRYLQAFARGDATIAGALTDDPAAAGAFLAEVRQAFGEAKAVTSLKQVAAVADGKTTATFEVTWTLGEGREWAYQNTLPLVRGGGHWTVHWSPALVHPKLGAGERLARRSKAGTPAVLDRAGAPLVLWQDAGPQPAEDGLAPLLQPGLGRVAKENGGDVWSVVRTSAGGEVLETLAGSDPAAAKPLTATLDAKAQRAAQAAVDGAGGPAVLIALQPSSGDILAVAQNSAAGPDPKAFTGLYAPGSTFKIATAAAVLQQGGTGVDTVLPCPGSARIGQRTIPNDDGFDLGEKPLHVAFARSCNTTFAQLAAGLPAAGLAEAASQFGLNADFEIPGISTETGKVEAAGSPAEQVEGGIGQGKVQASPFGVALMAATVAGGEAVTPKLWHGLDTQVNQSYQAPPAGVLGALRPMMREVVTSGTATELKGSGEVYGKTGTAQYGDGTQANGWFAGYRGDVAFAVLLQGADSSKPAVSVSAKFLGAL
nr:penicillin-binding transpeptidase domain-containing protein [Amycolatopsis nigrescens]